MATIAGGSNDGYCGTSLGTWANTRNHVGSTVDSNNASDTQAVFHFYHSGRGKWGIRRAFFEFNTLGISDEPSAATLKIYGYSNGSGDVIAVKSEQGGTLAAGDFNSFASSIVTQFGNTDGNGAGSLSSGIVPLFLTYSAEIDTWSTSGYNDIALNSYALADMVSLDTFKVCLMNYDNDYLDQDGTSTEANGLRWQERGDAQWPYIDYTPAVTAVDNATFFGANF
jgi:hypothetical protein